MSLQHTPTTSSFVASIYTPLQFTCLTEEVRYLLVYILRAEFIITPRYSVGRCPRRPPDIVPRFSPAASLYGSCSSTPPAHAVGFSAIGIVCPRATIVSLLASFAAHTSPSHRTSLSLTLRQTLCRRLYDTFAFRDASTRACRVAAAATPPTSYDAVSVVETYIPCHDIRIGHATRLRHAMP